LDRCGRDAVHLAGNGGTISLNLGVIRKMSDNRRCRNINKSIVISKLTWKTAADLFQKNTDITFSIFHYTEKY
jgi:hypothetical protein